MPSCFEPWGREYIVLGTARMSEQDFFEDAALGAAAPEIL